VATPAVARSATFSLAPSRAIGANDRINIGHVGVGVQGYGAHVRLMKDKAAENNTQQVAVCDLYRRRLRKAGTEMGISESAWYDDHRKMFENKDIDAVVVATADNWHAPIAIAAMQAGFHVYGEKPMCKGVTE